MIYAVDRFFSVANIGSLLPFLLCRLHQFPFRLQPVTLVIIVPAAVLKPDVIRTLLNLSPQARIRNFTIVFVGICTCCHLAPRFCFSSTLRTFPKLFIKTLKLANAVFLVLLILLVIPNVQSMELRHLRYFAAVAAHGSFSRAANQLHLTQPALSRQVKSLEEEIGIALIVRGQNAISLTSAGEAFYEEAKDILARVDVAVRRIKTRPPGEKLRIGYVHSLTAGIMPRVFERFQSYNKDVFLELSDLTTETMWQRAAAEQIDIAILPRSLEARFKGFQWVELQRLAPVLVVSKKNPLAKLTRIRPEKLRDKMLFGLGADKYPEYVPRLQAILKPFGVRPQLRNHTSEDIAALFIALEAQAGMAVLTEGVLPMLPSTLTVIRFSPELAPLLIAAGTPTLRPNPHSEAFLKILLEEINKSSRRKR